MPQTPVLMPYATLVSAFITQPSTPALRACLRPRVPRKNPDLPLPDLEIGNLIFGQSYHDLCSDQNNSSKNVLSVRDHGLPPFLIKSPPTAVFLPAVYSARTRCSN